jgi:hypothetical protein
MPVNVAGFLGQPFWIQHGPKKMLIGIFLQQGLLVEGFLKMLM